jgi:hypothetical protein
MLSDAQLIGEVRKVSAKSRRLAVLVLLAHVEQPARTGAIIEKAASIGFRSLKRWNVSDLLITAERKGEVGKLPAGWVLLEPGVEALSAAGVRLSANPRVETSNAVLPRELFAGTRGYIERVGVQINGCYDHGYYDGCAVMCRRLAETLIIEIYESQGRAQQLKGPDGYFLMLNGLLGVLLKDSGFNIGRNSARGLEALKALGDKSAHSRTFNARQADIDHLRPDFRAATEELLHLAKLIK